MKRTILFMTMLLLWSTGNGQEQIPATRVFEGNVLTHGNQNIWLIRDLGTFLDHPEKSKPAWDLLTELILFLPDSFYSSKPDRQLFLEFFYDHLDDLKYDSYLQLFVFNDEARNIAEINFPRVGSDDFLRNRSAGITNAVLDIERALKKQKNQYTPELIPACEIISRSRNDDAAQLILACLENGLILPSQAGTFLHRLTNHPCRISDPETIQAYYRSLLETKDVSEVVQQSYTSLIPIDENWFVNKVDLYARILLEIEHDPVATANVIYDICNTQESRSIYYILGFMDRLLRKNQLSEDFFSICQKSLANILPAAWENSPLIPQAPYKEDVRWSLEYWYAHHHQLTWNKDIQRFYPGSDHIQRLETSDMFTRADLKP